MEGLAIIEGKELRHITERITNIEQNQLAIMKKLESLFPSLKPSNVPDYISIQDACAKYKTSHVNLNNKMKLFKKKNGREVDRLMSGKYKLINEVELQKALKLKLENPLLFFKKKG